MNRKFLAGLTAGALVVAVGVSALPAGPLEEARALLKEKKYDQVDKKLEKLLARTSPPPAALTISLEAAEADGRFVTAQQRVKALLKARGMKDLALVYRAAKIARFSANYSDALGKYLYYAQQQKQAGPQLRDAMDYVLRRGAYPEMYGKYLKLFGSGGQAWNYGVMLLDRLIEARDGLRICRQGQLLLKTFTGDSRVNHVHVRLRDAAASGATGVSGKDRYVAPLRVMAKARPGDSEALYSMWGSAAGSMVAADRVNVLLTMQDAWKRPLRWELFREFGGNLSAIKDVDHRIQLARNFLGIEGIYRNSPDRRHYAWFVRTVTSRPDVFCVKGKTLVTRANVQQRFDALKARFRDDPQAVGPHLRDIQQRYLEKDPKAKQAFLTRHADILATGDFQDLLSLTKGKGWQSLLATATRGRDFLSALGLRLTAMEWMNRSVDPQVQAVTAARRALADAQAQLKRLETVAAASAKRAGAAKDPQQKKKLQDQATKDRNLARAQVAKVKGAENNVTRAERQLVAASGKQAAALLAAVTDYLTTHPATFAKDMVKTKFMYSPLLTADRKLGLLREMIAKAGPTRRMGQLLGDLAADKKNWGGTPKFEAVRNQLKQKRQGTDVFMRVCASLHEQGDGRRFRKQIEEMVKAVLARQPITLFGRKPVNAGELLMRRIFDQHLNLMWNDRNGLEGMAAIWAPFMAPGAPWARIATRLLEHSSPWSLGGIARRYIAVIKGGKGSPEVWEKLAQARNPDNDPKPIFAAVYQKMGWDNAMTYLLRQAINDAKRRAGWVKEMGKLAASPGFKLTAKPRMATTAYYLRQWAQDCKAPTNLPAVLWRDYLAGADRTRQFDLVFEAKIYGTYALSGHKAEAAKFLAGYMKLIERRSLADRIDSLGVLYATDAPPQEVAGRLDPGKFYHTLLTAVRDLYQKALVEDVTTVKVHWRFCEQVDWFAQRTERHWAPLKPRAAALGLVLAELLERGGGFSGSGMYRLRMMDRVVRGVIDRKDWARAARLLPYYALILRDNNNWDVNVRERIAPLAAALEAKKAYELAYVFATSVDRLHRLNEKIRKEVQLVKSRAGRMIPGLIAARKTDPSYPLHLAARALSFGDEARAWELTEPLLKLLGRVWESLDPDYVVWVVDQMRAQKRLAQGLEMAFTILLREDSLAAATAAHVLLIKGDIYRDMQKYRAAKVEYQSLRANKRYQRTRAGATALYRLVELLITTSDYAAAEGFLERMTESEDVRVQAEAYFLYAKMSTEQKEYKEAMDYIRKVRDRVPDHKEAAFLEGELSLVVPGGLAAWEEGVRVGDPRLRRVVIPGRVLSMKLRDTNLSIARGGKSVPVVIRTSKGADEERVDLVASSADKHLFTARITTSLGKVLKGNRNVEILGEDIVSYQIDPEYQKANDLHYPPKNLIVKADGRLAASSGQILTPEEEDQRALELKMRARAGQELSRKFDILGSGRNVRPGSPIYVQVMDDDRDVSIARDTVAVKLTTSSGDIIERFELKETGPHSAIFRGKVPTGIPLPKASASDTAEGKRPECLINTTKKDTWSSLADARKPKFVEVDTMTSHEMKAVSLKTTDAAKIRQLTLLGMLAGDYMELASYPERKQKQKGGVMLQHVQLGAGANLMIPAQIHNLANAKNATRGWRAGPVFSRDASPMKNRSGWMATRIHGAFYAPEDRTMEIKFGQPLSPNNWQVAWLMIDGRAILGGSMTKQTIEKTRHIDLVRGLHTFELLVRDHHNKSQASIVYRRDDGTFAPFPAGWFSPKEHPELDEFLRPKGKIAMTEDGFVATMTEPVRLRKVKWVFEDFSGNAVSAGEIRVVDAEGEVVVPGDKDFTSGKTNQTLEIAAGDEIVVTYRDEHRVSGGSPDLTARLRASYFNGDIEIAYEEVFRSGNRVASRYYAAKRFRIGDQLTIRVGDYDEDLTGEADTINVKVQTARGESAVIKLRETGEHTGIFRQIIRTGAKTEGDMIRTRPGDKITVWFLDRENTTPGIPYERSYSVWEAEKSTPQPLVYKTSIILEEDKSDAALAKAYRLKRKMKTKSLPILYKETVVARHPDYDKGPQDARARPPATAPAQEAGEEEAILCSTRGPLLFQAKYPTLALHAGSSYRATVVAESEIRAAKAQGRDPNVLEVRMPLTGIGGAASSVGFAVRVQSRERYSGAGLLTEGIFSGAVRLKLGSPGDDPYALGPDDAPRALAGTRRLPTLIVSGSDVVYIRFQDVVTKKVFTRKVRLQTDGRLELLDPTYTARRESIHLGEKFFVRVSDLDSDTSDERDEVPVLVRSASGDELKLALTETLPHSGVFTGWLEPLYAGTGERAKKTIDPKDRALHLGFGDKVTFEYLDAKSIAAGEPREITSEGRIFFGADAELAVFTKRFKDPEMAVKTRFLMAEALFEIAKHYRKLDKKADANEVLARGKRVLEEALRDYPDTSLAPQGKFLLANLSQELDKYPEAVGRYAGVIATWPDSAFAPRSQLKKAICLEKLKNYDQACEEYVKLTYVYPEHPLVADATVRLGHYYYKMKKYGTAGQVFFKFQQRNPAHRLAAKALFSSGQCYFKQGDWKTAAKRFDLLVEEYRDQRKVRPQAMYFLGESLFNAADYKKAYQAFVKLTWDYPEDYWAKVARGRLTEDKLSNVQ